MCDLYFSELQNARASARAELKKKDEEIQEFKKKHYAEISQLKNELKQRELEFAATINVVNTEATQRVEAYKAEFLASDEFVQICGPKIF